MTCEAFSSEFTFNDKSPIYRQIYDNIARAFARGLIEPGERIPSIRDLALQLKVNANTVQRVYQELERDELIVSKRGTGYFFTEDETMATKINNNMAAEVVRNFLNEMHALGFTTEQIIEFIKKGGYSDATAAD